MSAQVSHEEIRRMVRELLRDAVVDVSRRGTEPAAPRETAAVPAQTGEVGGLSERVRAALAGAPGGGAIEIAMASDSDLNGFAQQVALCALERDLLGAIASNRVRFRLAGGRGDDPATQQAKTQATTPTANDGEAYHWEQGLLSETRITEIARTHAKLVLGQRALMTPLAWDRARSLGLQVTRMKP